jgi:SAM-dependent methyltransferase
MPEKNNRQPQFSEWFDTPLGEKVLAAEKQLLEGYLSRMFGYHILQLGCSEDHSLIEDSPVGHKILFSPCFHNGARQAVADNEELPLAEDSMDVVLIHHALDFTPDSHRLLREAMRVLRPGGRLLVLGFNPVSAWGIARWFRRKSESPWNARFISLRRLSDWLKLLDLHVDNILFGVHFLPLQYGKLLRNADRMEAFGKRFASPLGGAYFVQGTKQVVPITPIVPRWRPLRTAATVMPATENVRAKIH